MGNPGMHRDATFHNRFLGFGIWLGLSSSGAEEA